MLCFQTEERVGEGADIALALERARGAIQVVRVYGRRRHTSTAAEQSRLFAIIGP